MINLIEVIGLIAVIDAIDEISLIYVIDVIGVIQCTIQIFFDKVVELVGVGSVINGAYPV